MDTVTFFIIVGVLFYALTCWAVIDVALREFSSLPVKAAWGLTAFIPFVGWMIYFSFGARRGTRRKRPTGKNDQPENNV
ncbi:PLDc N-terminal domain-containing protein [Desulfococcus sp.]|uniref:PLDc N-terminal domain-containing protein n=1 Tax=Desulfococcus sp. TaxID=2025834 RepID=UPI0035936D32